MQDITKELKDTIVKVMESKRIASAHMDKSIADLQYVLEVAPEDQHAIEKAREQVMSCTEAFLDCMLKGHKELRDVVKKAQKYG